MIPYPLQWPVGVARTKWPETSRFKVTVPVALTNVQNSLRRFSEMSGRSVKDIVVSSNYTLGVSAPVDAGVAVWFTWDGETRVIAVDRYKKIQENLQAIHYILEARVTEARYGSFVVLQRAFMGFNALPHTGPKWWEVLGVSGTASRGEIDEAYKSLIKAHHPDTGGDAAKAAEINAAYDQAKQVVPR